MHKQSERTAENNKIVRRTSTIRELASATERCKVGRQDRAVLTEEGERESSRTGEARRVSTTADVPRWREIVITNLFTGSTILLRAAIQKQQQHNVNES